MALKGQHYWWFHGGLYPL